MNKELYDRALGCLIGGAAGDALGYPVEFISAAAIFNRYGDAGITEYAPDRYTGTAIISDDTQMTLFTAAGLLMARALGEEPPRRQVALAYNDWYRTQTMTFDACQKLPLGGVGGVNTWLMQVPELFHRRAPGNTCLAALAAQVEHPGETGDWIAHRVNNRRGCGGVMRVAPMGLMTGADADALDLEGAQLAAITHGHSLGYMPAAALTHIVRRAAFDDAPLIDIARDTKAALERLFENDEHLPKMLWLLDAAILLSQNGDSDLKNIAQLGEGWVGDEALAIALYCVLRHPDDFSACLIAAVNHSGDSDSTGAIAGNILGARLGYAALDDKWIENLELVPVMQRLAEEIATRQGGALHPNS